MAAPVQKDIFTCPNKLNECLFSCGTIHLLYLEIAQVVKFYLSVEKKPLDNEKTNLGEMIICVPKNAQEQIKSGKIHHQNVIVTEQVAVIT